MMSARAWRTKELSNLESSSNVRYERTFSAYSEIQEGLVSLFAQLEASMLELQADPTEIRNWASEQILLKDYGVPLSPRALEFVSWIEARNLENAKTKKTIKLARRMELIASAQLEIVVTVLRRLELMLLAGIQNLALHIFLLKFCTRKTISISLPAPLEHRPQHQTNAPNIAA